MLDESSEQRLGDALFGLSHRRQRGTTTKKRHEIPPDVRSVTRQGGVQSPSHPVRYRETRGTDDDSLIVWDADTLERRRELRGHTNDIQDVGSGPTERWSRPGGTGRRRSGTWSRTGSPRRCRDTAARSWAWR
jgi:hypothetical protein